MLGIQAFYSYYSENIKITSFQSGIEPIIILLPTLSHFKMLYFILPVALSKGAIIELPWAYIEARRGVGMGEEGQLPYTPELPLPSEATVNYNLTVQRAARVYTAPAALESTSLVLVTGLGKFY